MIFITLDTESHRFHESFIRQTPKGTDEGVS